MKLWLIWEHWEQTLLIDESDPNISMNNLHQHINDLFDEFDPYKKLLKKEYKFRSKPWINRNLLAHEKNVINYCTNIVKQKKKTQYMSKSFIKNINLLEIP